MESTLICIFLGVLAGIFAGMGMGGGTFLIPLLILFLSFSQLSAQSVNLIAFVPMALIALIIHFKNHLVLVKSGLIVILISAIGCLLGVYLLQFITSNYLRLGYAIFLCAVGVWLFVSNVLANKKNDNN